MQDMERVRAFIADHHVAVLATVTPDYLPEAAVVGIALYGDGLRLVFGTSNLSRKSQNIQTNARVALVIGWDHGKTVQYEGVASELTGSELETFQSSEMAHMPTVAKYLPPSVSKFFVVEPRWIKFTDVSVSPWEELELKFT